MIIIGNTVILCVYLTPRAAAVVESTQSRPITNHILSYYNTVDASLGSRFEVVIAHNTHYNIFYCPRNLHIIYIICVCVYMEIAAHMVLPCHYEKKNKKYNERAV